MAETILMAVHSPARGGGHKGVFAGGLFWRTGTSVQEVALDRVRDVQAKQNANMLKILAVGKEDVEKALAAEAKAAKDVAAAQEEADKRIAAAKVKLPAGIGPRTLPGSSPAPHSLAQPSADAARADLEARAREIGESLDSRRADLEKEADELKKNVNAAQKKIGEAHDELDKRAAELTKRQQELDAKAAELAKRESAPPADPKKK